MRCEILDSAVSAMWATWHDAWQRSPSREPFAHPGYCQLFAEPTHRAVAVHFSCDAGEVLFPLILRDISAEPWFADNGLTKPIDAISPYGYGGPYWWGDDAEAVAAHFWPLYNEWAKDTGLVSEFARLSLFSSGILVYPGAVRVDRHNVVRELHSDLDTIWRDVKHKVRKNVNRATRDGLEVAFDRGTEHLDEFVAIYEQTMERREAVESYRWQRPFFERLCASLSGHFAFAHVIKGERVISTELLLLSADAMYSFLGGTDARFFDSRPNDLLKWAAIAWGKENGKRYFVLGGGHSPQDGIFQYKAAFAPQGLWEFRVGSRVHDAVAYDTLIRLRRQSMLDRNIAWEPRPGFFPEYRA